jgi:hypothetical protein
MSRFLLLLFILVAMPVHGWAATKAEDKNALDAAMASVDAAERRFFER